MIRIGIIGMGGFAASHQNTAIKLESEGVCKLVCSCDKDLDNFAGSMKDWDYKGRNISVFDDYIDMLNACKKELDMVIIPTPIHLHAQMHKASVERGIPVYLEKPPTLDYSELEDMLLVEQKAKKSTNVGFNYIIETTRQNIKRRLLKGEFGALRRIELFGNWPRPDKYFARNNWAGKLMLGDSLVLDSIMGNAMAHYVHNVLCWAGKDEVLSWAQIDSISAELYRANKIQGSDTVFVEASTDTDVNIRMALTHSCNGEQSQYERLYCDNAVIDYLVNDRHTITLSNGTVETGETDLRNLLVENVRHFCRYIECNEKRPVNRLEDCMPIVHLNDMAYIASGRITTVPDQYVTCEKLDGDAGTTYGIHNIAQVCNIFLSTGMFPSQQGLPWSIPGGKASHSDLPKLREVINGIISAVHI